MSTAFAHRNLPRLLLQAREAVMAHNRPWLREHGLSDQQWRVLRVLGEHGTVETGRVAREAYILGPSLTGVLARMERDGLVHRTVHPVIPPKVEYRLTELGHSLGESFCGVWRWAERNLDAVATARTAFDARTASSRV
ncbi:MAG: Homoprotocatechuate degradative operon repressor [uncultured Ramlibacter sp.]|uniref:Homoprotocatechuate degradative operon repressor n=1 Tax=uncultured Ramlibacter sp. TaxID=260755 RepID=A0A6J4PEJ3_9BURK|nr:MAG: Homoprotocatechuate degradative operon repressor [uncultured Ramlibacter sp.]